MLVKMLSTRKGSPNGTDVQTYFEGHQYEVHGELLDVFIREGWCETADPFREGEGDGEAANAAADTATEGHPAADGPLEKAAGAGEPTNSEGEQPEIVLAEADVLAKYTRDELLDLAEEQGVEVPSDVVKKADVVKFLAGKLKVTVE